MKISSINKIITIFLIILLTISIYAKEKKKVVILGSSVASGWVTSYKTKYDMKNGWAYRLERNYSDEYEVINISIPGNKTTDVLNRLEKDLFSLSPNYVIISLSLSNEGIMGENKDSVFTLFNSNLLSIINKCKENNITPIIGYCYPNDEYSEIEYEYIKKMNAFINGLNYSSINFCGNINNGKGNFINGYTYDEGHPDNTGHEEMFYSLSTSIFEKIFSKELKIDRSIKGTKINNNLYFIPKEIMHSFTISIEISNDEIVKSFEIENYDENNIKIELFKNKLIFDGEELFLNASNNKYSNLCISYNFLLNKVAIYLDGKFLFNKEKKLIPLCFVFYKNNKTEYRNLTINRATLSGEEIAQLNEGIIQKGSLDLYVPFNKNTANIINSKLQLTNIKTEYFSKKEELKNRIKLAEQQKKNEPVVIEKKPINLDPSIFKNYVGVYNFQPGLDVKIYIEHDYLILEDFDRNKFKLMPETENQFFIKHPLSEFIVLFNSNNNGIIESVTLSINGKEFLLKKI